MDSIIDNGSKEQTGVKPKAPDRAALFEAAKRTLQEETPASEPGKKPSVLALTESTLTKLTTLTDKKFGQLELYPDFDVWNNTMRRYVRRGSKGIALIDTSGDRERSV